MFSLNQTLFAKSDEALLLLEVSDDIFATERSTIWTANASTGHIPESYEWPEAFESAENTSWPDNANIRVFGWPTTGSVHDGAFNDTGIVQSEMLLDEVLVLDQ
ncbi:hypothetical protein POJ06DRAFT_240964 [Lipomyces tetrasporus]|uniref:Uncharacterized protein n=1 Tax=Lipomyces tetrasporus TaxID=54092 RepID=A0AAD7QPV1_9ASCO|nr:uncharacterized protein POJ06DRAFT_240964 [Lipomyces tetrasporus]KAJ8097652.1 hypothetical protein POJ06DRAFT_240964 [Lipomyces tetrasporus]